MIPHDKKRLKNLKIKKNFFYYFSQHLKATSYMIPNFNNSFLKKKNLVHEEDN